MMGKVTYFTYFYERFYPKPNSFMAVTKINPESEILNKLKQHLGDSSRALADLTSNMVYDNPKLLKHLVEVSFQEKGPLAQRASRVVTIVCCRFPELFRPFISPVIRRLHTIPCEGALRNFLKIFAEAVLPVREKDKTDLLNQCFDYLTGSYAVAVKMYSMEIIFRLSEDIPEIRKELYHIIGEQMPEASSGFQSRGKKIMKKCSHPGLHRAGPMQH